MILGQTLKRAHYLFAALVIAVLLALAPRAAMAQDAAATETTAETAEVAATAADVATPATETAGAYTPMAPTEGKGMPVDGLLDVQDQYSPIGQSALGLHNGLVWVMAIISIFVLGLLLYVIVRYNKRANPVPSKTTHNTLIEVVWTLVPVLVLVAIALPSISLLAKQYETPPADAVTVKVTGYQWYWGYNYPDNGDFEIISNMLPEADAIANGEPPQLAVDNRLVLPVDTPIRMQIIAADVIHSFAIPSLWFKLDAVPGRLNEKLLTISEPGVYYGQCSELCGIKHGYMPIAIEALPRDQWEAWVIAQGGTLAGAEEAAEADEAAVADAGDTEGAADTAAAAE
ncbi:cytochrome c oxidase subunit II [Altererythrobacter arenosus]|uniref:Cytochrome c oxidase subunit 2 n=1 Tax=Altererythrobacter arenosus TaxID=3032592 RepID=A0ABY8FRF3_9SPHN|nr:cytochrome c oxidase subunit II [Altererythrobacter sp. CAU 1644]WFL77594.1 cytochrome c oxidase subunit II [Altererythrobacter sp. CAU 1644]